jgi:hypothetical protein
VLREYGYVGSVDVVRRRLRELRPPVVRPSAADRLSAGVSRTGFDGDRFSWVSCSRS